MNQKEKDALRKFLEESSRASKAAAKLLAELTQNDWRLTLATQAQLKTLLKYDQFMRRPVRKTLKSSPVSTVRFEPYSTPRDGVGSSAGSNKPRSRRQSTPQEVGDSSWNGGVAAYVWDDLFEGLLISLSHRRRNGVWDGGGPFYCYKYEQSHRGKTSGTYYRIGNKYEANAVGVAGVPQERWTSQAPPGFVDWPSLYVDLSAQYATGYKLARPDKPAAGLGQFLVELRDLPQVPFRRGAQQFRSLFTRTGGALRNVPRVLVRELSDFRNLGSEYLNGVFGWKPFVNDLRKMYNLQQRLDARIARLVRENGKWTRRKAQVKSESEVVKDYSRFYGWAYANVRGGPPNWMFDGGTQYDITTRWSEKVWFSGSFRYYTPDIGSSQWTVRAKQALFGALPSPETLWEVLPWSWLIDWFTNVGDIYANVSPGAVDNLVLGDSFIMKHYTWERTCTASCWHSALPLGADPKLRSGWPALNATYASSEKHEIKARVSSGNPFGLGFKMIDCTAGQLGILAALGISRSRLS